MNGLLFAGLHNYKNQRKKCDERRDNDEKGSLSFIQDDLPLLCDIPPEFTKGMMDLNKEVHHSIYNIQFTTL